MTQYIVSRPDVAVEALSPQDAVRIVMDGGGTLVQGIEESRDFEAWFATANGTTIAVDLTDI